MNNIQTEKFVHPAKARIQIIISALILLGNLSIPINAQDRDNLRIMSFNLRYGTAEDGENSWRFRKENVVTVIKESKPDLIGFQEALNFQNEELLKMMPEYSCAGAGRDDGRSAGEFSSVFYRKDRIEVDTIKTFWFSDTPEIPGSKNWGNNITRICTWIHARDKLTGESFYHFNLHLDHESQYSRERSALLVIKKIQEKKEPVILTGDFNCGEENNAIKSILSGGMKDCYRLRNSKRENEGTFNSFKGETGGDRIDFVFISDGLDAEKSEIIRRNFEGKYPSDHFPVTAVIGFRK